MRVHSFLAKYPEFALVYFDDAAFVYVRRTYENRDFLRKNEFRYLKPLGRFDPKDADHLIDEAKRAIALNPATLMAHYVLGLAYELKGEPRLAADELREALSIKPKDPKVLKALTRVRLALPEVK